MLSEKLFEKYGYTRPIFTNEIIETFPEYSRSRIFQLLQKEVEDRKIKHYSRGVYYISYKSKLGFGDSIINYDDVMDKRYIKSGDDHYGIYGRLHLELKFLISYQLPYTLEIISNNESKRIRKYYVGDRLIILRKSRTTITKDNYATYTIMELFDNINLREDYKNNATAQEEIKNFINENNVTKSKLYEMSSYFPARTIKKLAESGLLNEIT